MTQFVVHQFKNIIKGWTDIYFENDILISIAKGGSEWIRRVVGRCPVQYHWSLRRCRQRRWRLLLLVEQIQRFTAHQIANIFPLKKNPIKLTCLVRKCLFNYLGEGVHLDRFGLVPVELFKVGFPFQRHFKVTSEITKCTQQWMFDGSIKG